MAKQRTSVKVTRIIEVTAEEIERIILEHYTNGKGDVTFDVSSGGMFRGLVIHSTTEELTKPEEV